MIGSACIFAHVCVGVAPGSLHVVVILGLMKEFLPPSLPRHPPPPPSLPTTGVRFGAKSDRERVGQNRGVGVVGEDA